MKQNFPATRTSLFILAGLLCVFFLTACCHGAAHTSEATASTKPAAAHDNHNAVATTEEATEIAQNIPHYFDDPEKAKPFPKTLDPNSMNAPAAKLAYATARRIPEVLAQQPCYCYCDRGFGHGSLLGCHVDNHSAD